MSATIGFHPASNKNRFQTYKKGGTDWMN